MLKQQTVNSGERRLPRLLGARLHAPSTRTSAPTRTSPTSSHRAHALGLKVYLDVVVNHTGDVDPALERRHLLGHPVPRLSRQVLQGGELRDRQAFPLPGRAVHARGAVRGSAATGTLKKPAWLNDPLNYHDRGNIDFGSCSPQCFEQGDFFGLDDLFTEKPNVMKRPRRRSTRRGSRASTSTASASTPRSTSTPRSSSSGCRRSARRRRRRDVRPTSRSSAR